MQRAYMSKLLELAEHDKNILHVISDSGTGFDEMFRKNFPDQIYNFGISEQHMIGAAAGLASLNKIPFVYTSGAFLAYRAFEFIRDDVCFNNLNIKIIGMGSGLSWATLGPSHHTTEDIAVLRALPNLKILSPATPFQVMACVELAYKINSPVYIRIGMNSEKEFFNDANLNLKFGSSDLIIDTQASDVCIFSTGSILEEAESAATILNGRGIKTSLINCYSLKPFDESAVDKNYKHAKLFVSVEEHNIMGGLGGIISEIMADKGIGVKLKRIGLEDKFASGYGSHKAVRAANNLSSEKIVQAILEALNERV